MIEIWCFGGIASWQKGVLVKLRLSIRSGIGRVGGRCVVFNASMQCPDVMCRWLFEVLVVMRKLRWRSTGVGRSEKQKVESSTKVRKVDGG